MPSVEQPASLPDPPSQAEGPRAASSRDVSPCPTIRARPILQKVRYDGDEWFGLDYNMNLYRGCAHGCIYCDSRSECYRIDGFDQVRVKFDALSILRRELRSRRVRGIVGVGAMSDTYNPFDPTLPVRYRETYGERYFCNSPRAAQNRTLFRTLCKEHGLLWRMADIIAAYKPAHPLGTQASLSDRWCAARSAPPTAWKTPAISHDERSEDPTPFGQCRPGRTPSFSHPFGFRIRCFPACSSPTRRHALLSGRGVSVCVSAV